MASIAGMPGGDGSPKVLWVTAEPPDHTRHGGSIRQAYLFESLSKQADVDLLVAGRLEDRAVAAAARDVIALPARPATMTEDAVIRRLLQLAITLVSPYPLPAYMAGPARRQLRRALGGLDSGYDAVCVEHEALAPLVGCRRSARWIITFHHILSEMIEREVQLAPGRRQRWFRERDVEKARRIETAALGAYDQCIACSAEDAATLASLDNREAAERISVVPNGVDLSRFQVQPLPAEPSVLFPGTLRYSANVDGATWFCAEIWPRVLEAVPNATLILAGRNPTADVLGLAGLQGIQVHADVPSMVPYFEATRVVVVPLRIGTGTRLKALEAMAAGRPLVGTTAGLAGLGIEDGVQARVADDPETFAGALVELLRRDDLATAVGAAGRSHVEARFGWERVGERFVGTVLKLIESR